MGLQADVGSIWEAGAACGSLRHRVSIGALQASRRPSGKGACLVTWWQQVLQRVSQLVLLQVRFQERWWEGKGCLQSRGVWLASLRPQLWPPAERGLAQAWQQRLPLQLLPSWRWRPAPQLLTLLALG